MTNLTKKPENSNFEAQYFEPQSCKPCQDASFRRIGKEYSFYFQDCEILGKKSYEPIKAILVPHKQWEGLKNVPCIIERGNSFFPCILLSVSDTELKYLVLDNTAEGKKKQEWTWFDYPEHFSITNIFRVCES